MVYDGSRDKRLHPSAPPSFIGVWCNSTRSSCCHTQLDSPSDLYHFRCRKKTTGTSWTRNVRTLLWAHQLAQFERGLVCFDDDGHGLPHKVSFRVCSLFLDTLLKLTQETCSATWWWARVTPHGVRVPSLQNEFPSTDAKTLFISLSFQMQSVVSQSTNSYSFRNTRMSVITAYAPRVTHRRRTRKYHTVPRLFTGDITHLASSTHGSEQGFTIILVRAERSNPLHRFAGQGLCTYPHSRLVRSTKTSGRMKREVLSISAVNLSVCRTDVSYTQSHTLPNLGLKWFHTASQSTVQSNWKWKRILTTDILYWHNQ